MMKKFLGKYKLHFLFILIIISFVWIPVLWNKQIEFDIAVFANEYYKTLIKLGEIVFGFWLANIFFKNYKDNEVKEKISEDWIKQKSELSEIINQLEKIESDEINTQEIVDSLWKIDIRFEKLAEIILSMQGNNNFYEICEFAYEYKRNQHNNISHLIKEIKNGEIIFLRPLTKKTLGIISELKIWL